MSSGHFFSKNLRIMNWLKSQEKVRYSAEQIAKLIMIDEIEAKETLEELAKCNSRIHKENDQYYYEYISRMKISSER